MSYIVDIEKELQARLEQGSALNLEEWEGWSADFIAFVKEAVLKSFKNGLEAGGSRAKRKTGPPPKNLPTNPHRAKE